MVVSLDSYRDSVQRSQELDSKHPISCTQPKHAVEIYNLFFRGAKKEVLIFQEHLQREVFDNPEVVREMERAVYRKVNVELVARRPDEGSYFLERLEALQTSTPFAHYFEIPKNMQFNTDKVEGFLVADSKTYRLQDKNGEAIAYFNRPDIAGKLAECFVSIRRRVEGIRSL